jgi:hypothetical protein
MRMAVNLRESLSVGGPDVARRDTSYVAQAFLQYLQYWQEQTMDGGRWTVDGIANLGLRLGFRPGAASSPEGEHSGSERLRIAN